MARIKQQLRAAALSCLLVASLAFGQATTGAINGVVSDQSGAVISGATVRVRHLETNATRTSTTEADGRYYFPGLPVGPYEVTTEAAGFGKVVRGGVVLLLNQVAVVNVELRPAAVTEVVNITEDAPLVNTTNAEVGVRFDEKRLTDLPSSGQFGIGGGFRDVFSAALSAPGVSQQNPGNNSFASGTDFSANGNRVRSNNFMIDGQDSNDPSVTGRIQFMNNPDIVQEFRLITNQPLAEYGRNSGSVVNVITKAGGNAFHGSLFEFYNSNVLNSRNNLEKAAGFAEAPFINEHQYGGSINGPIRKDRTFFSGGLQRWTIRQLGAGTTISGVPTEAGRQLIQSLAGNRPQVAALLRFLPPAQNTRGTPVRLAVAGRDPVSIPVGDLTSSTGIGQTDWQWMTRVDHRFEKHQIGGRYLFADDVTSGAGQVTPPGNTSESPLRTQAATAFVTSNVSPRTLNEFRVSYQRYASVTNSTNPESETIPSIEIPELGLNAFNASVNRTAIGLAANLPQFRTNNTYQIQNTTSWTPGAHALKFGVDLRRTDVKSFFFPIIRGRLVYPTLQNLVDDAPQTADINKPLPGGSELQYYKYDDYFFFVQDTWQLRPGFTLNLGLRYETPGNFIDSLVKANQSIVAANRGLEVFRLTPVPQRDTNNWQPRIGFSWAPGARQGLLGRFMGPRFVVRGGYARTNDAGFINIGLNVGSAFPFLGAINAGPLPNAFTQLVNQPVDLTNPAALNLLARTVVAGDFRAPYSDQYSLGIERQFAENYVFRLGYVGTKGTALFETLDGNPRTLCGAVPMQQVNPTTVAVAGCPRVDPARGTIRLRANSGSSIYHSLQASMDKRFSGGFSAGAHYTWSSFIDSSSEIFNPSARGEVAVAQNSFDRRAERGRSTFDRPHRLAVNFVYELPFLRSQQGLAGRIIGGWQFASFITMQGGSPFTPLNGVDVTQNLGGISGLVGDATRPNVNTPLDLSSMSVEDIQLAGGRTLFRPLLPCARIGTTLTCAPQERFGNAGRNILRSDGIANLDLSLSKNIRLTENHRLQLRADAFNLTNTRNFGIPEARVNNNGFGNQWGTDGGNRRVFVALRYMF